MIFIDIFWFCYILCIVCETTYIYGLVDPRTDEVRYVGKSGDPEKRLKYHIQQCHHRTHKAHWIRELLALDLKPVVQVIAKVPKAEWKWWERHYIEEYRKTGRLTNGTKGGDGWSAGMPLPEGTGAKISESLRSSSSTRSLKKGIAQYSREGKLIVVWSSASDAARELGISRRVICRCANRRRGTSGGFVWVYVRGGDAPRRLPKSELARRFFRKKDSDETRKRKSRSTPKRRVLQYQKDGSFIRSWDSVTEAASALGIHKVSIYNCADKDGRSGGGFVWKYADSSFSRSKTVAQYSSSGVFIRTWPSAREAIEETGIYPQALYSCAQGRTKTAGGFIWFYVNSVDFVGDLPEDQKCRLSLSKRSRVVNQYTMSGDLVKTWESVAAAARAVGLSASTLASAARGRFLSAAGYKWSYPTD